MKDRRPYNHGFYESQLEGSRKSAAVVLRHLFQHLRPQSVVDFGCGAATWLAAARSMGVKDVLGVDGDWIDSSLLVDRTIPFRSIDLERRIDLDRKFDLAISLEVAEHLSPARGPSFVEDICASSSIALFSAAIPNQDGTHHINEQWQSYWVEQFEENGFACFDLIRPKVWNDDAVEFWYKQNTFLYVRRDCLGEYPGLPGQIMESSMVDILHPRMNQSLGDLRLRERFDIALGIPGALVGALRRHVKRRA